MSKTLPLFTGAEVRTEALETKRVVCPAFLREKVTKISFIPIQQLRCRCASEWAVNPPVGGVSSTAVHSRLCECVEPLGMSDGDTDCAHASSSNLQSVAGLFNEGKQSQ